jgi:hypothetical protein
LSGTGAICPVASWTIRWAREFTSRWRFLARVGMAETVAQTRQRLEGLAGHRLRSQRAARARRGGLAGFPTPRQRAMPVAAITGRLWKPPQKQGIFVSLSFNSAATCEN